MAPVQRQLGRNGPMVTAPGLGMMSIAGAYGQQNTLEEKLAFLDHAYAIGQRHWDTADVYPGADQILGEWFGRNPEKRKDIFLSTKVGLAYDPVTWAQSEDSSPEYLRKSVEKSLKDLGVETIDLLYCHRVDGKTPIEKTIEAMVELKK
jgi:aryl-alcohol dehydrogenase-like predicted oxidoreductase